MGSSYSDLINGKNFANSGVVLVSINYRLGAFGFLSRSEKGEKGNNGLRD